jgi:hypothetical protein
MNRLLVGSLSIALGLVSAILVQRAAPPGAASGLASDKPYRDGTAGKPL